MWQSCLAVHMVGTTVAGQVTPGAKQQCCQDVVRMPAAHAPGFMGAPG